jgi:hypothetical protein
MVRRQWFACLVAVAALGSTPLLAHHAKEYIDIESYSTPARNSFLFHLHFDTMSEDKNDPSLDHWEITPGLSWGVTDRLLFDAHTHYARFGLGHIVAERQAEFAPHGPSPFLEAAAFTLHYRVIEGAGLDVAVSGTFEAPFARAKELLDAKNVYAGCLILSREFGRHGNVTLNLTGESEDGEETWSYGLGVKTPLAADPHGIAAGIEWLGEFENFHDTWSILPGIYLPLGSPDTVFKFGVEMSRNMERTRANLSLIYNF